MSVVENVQAALESHHGGSLRLTGRACRRHREEALAMLGRVGLADRADEPCAQLAYGDLKRLELALALAISRERHLETTELGRAFRIAAGVFATPPLDSEEIAYPVAAGASCAAMGIGRDQALLACLQGFSAALVSVAVRLVPIGQTAGLETLRDLAPVIASAAARASRASLDDLGAITIGADISAMRHESQHSRIFRS